MSPLQLYIHIPYCLHKCPYCDFNSHVRPAVDWDAYRRALLGELAHWAMQPQFAGRGLASLFFGGGTPSLAPPRLIGAVVDAAANHLGLTADAEITLEANPGAADAGRFAGYKEAGVNRISIGVQSFDRAELAWLERIHDGDEARHAFELARRAGFANVNLDLIYALPGQGLTAWMGSLERAIAMNPEHLSCYQLTVEPHTLLASRHARTPYPLPDDELALRFLWRTRERLQAAGYAAYEVSNFARQGFHCRHNDGYWLYRDYIGIGAGAAGKWDTGDGGAHRYANTRSPESYLKQALAQGQAIGGAEDLAPRLAAAEAVWMGLRRCEGMDRPGFAARFGQGVLTMFEAELAPWLGAGSLIADTAGLRLSDEGLAQADSVAAALF